MNKIFIQCSAIIGKVFTKQYQTCSCTVAFTRRYAGQYGPVGLIASGSDVEICHVVFKLSYNCLVNYAGAPGGGAAGAGAAGGGATGGVSMGGSAPGSAPGMGSNSGSISGLTPTAPSPT